MKSKIIEVKHSYIPGDPNAIAANLEFTRAEDDPHAPIPIFPYEGWNFLPTDYGYRSYFGTNAVLNIPILPSRCDELLLIQSTTFANLAIALCEDGIWTIDPSVIGGSWTQAVVYAYSSAIHRMWTHVRINNQSYFYQEARPTVNKLSALNALTTFTPSFLTMSGQEGIFQAGGRLGFWDTLGSVSWSNVFDFSDFTPSLETLAGNAQFNSVLGEIIVCKKHGDGFIIYASASVTTVHQSGTATGLLWDAQPVSTAAGITHAGEVTIGTSDMEHYVYTTQGLVVIKAYNSYMKQHDVSSGLTAAIDFIRENKEPVYIRMMQGRYLFICLINPNYIHGISSSYETTAATVGASQVYFNDLSECVDSNGENMFFTGTVVLPSSSFLIDAGSDLPMYSIFSGALVYDTVYQKWGKFKGNFRLVMELTPSNGFDSSVSGFTDFGMNVGILEELGVIRLFDNRPTDSYLRWGKIGFSRLGFTTLFEASVHFRSNSTGTLEIESSLNDRDLRLSLKRTTSFSSIRQVTHKSSFAARWHTLALRGQWDLQYAQFNGKMSGMR